MYSLYQVVTYVTYCHTNNKMIVYTRNDVEYSLSPFELQDNAHIHIWCIRFSYSIAKFKNENSLILINVQGYHIKQLITLKVIVIKTSCLQL